MNQIESSTSFQPHAGTDRAGAAAAVRAVAGALAKPRIRPTLVAGVARLTEFVGVMAIGALIYLAYVGSFAHFGWLYAVPVLLSGALVVLFIQAADGYSPPALRAHLPHFGRVLAAWTLLFALFTLIAFFAKVGDLYSRVWLAGWYIGGLVFFTAFRFGLAAFVRRWTASGRMHRSAVIVGGGKPAEELINALERQADNDIQICGVFDDRQDPARSPSMVAGYPKLGTVSELVDFARNVTIDLLIVSLPLTAENRLLQFLKQLWVLPVDIRLSAHTARLKFRPRSYSYVGTLPFIDIFDKPIADWDYILKRGFDLVFGTLAIILLSPVMLATAIAIRLDSPGPILFKQKRYGFNNELIEVYKFRSMYVDQADTNAARLVTRDDPRVTRVGRFIRRTSVDELPQLFNALTGKLSLVGPRPHAVLAKADNRLYNDVVDGYFARHRVRPGITGWAQINGWRGETETEEQIQQRVEHDLFYIENWSLMFDLYILLMTPFRLLKSDKAY
jgi:Undecaprenyl-phosphate glucose phosphotransferase